MNEKSNFGHCCLWWLVLQLILLGGIAGDAAYEMDSGTLDCQHYHSTHFSRLAGIIVGVSLPLVVFASRAPLPAISHR